MEGAGWAFRGSAGAAGSGAGGGAAAVARAGARPDRAAGGGSGQPDRGRASGAGDLGLCGAARAERAGRGGAGARAYDGPGAGEPAAARSEEHTSEIQSLMRSWSAVFCLKKHIQIIDKLEYIVITKH